MASTHDRPRSPGAGELTTEPICQRCGQPRDAVVHYAHGENGTLAGHWFVPPAPPAAGEPASLMQSLHEADEQAKALPKWATDITAAHAAQYDTPATPASVPPAGTPTREPGEVGIERALTALYLEVPLRVADHVAGAVRRRFAELKAERDQARQDARDDFFSAISAVAEAMDEAANGPNRPLHRRSLHAVAIPMADILRAKALCEANDDDE